MACQWHAGKEDKVRVRVRLLVGGQVEVQHEGHLGQLHQQALGEEVRGHQHPAGPAAERRTLQVRLILMACRGVLVACRRH